MMIKSLFAAAALAGLAFSTAATAADPKDPVAVNAPAPAEVAAAPKPEPKYCTVDTLTGSRVPVKVCKTRSEWMKQGFDPLNP